MSLRVSRHTGHMKTVILSSRSLTSFTPKSPPSALTAGPGSPLKRMSASSTGTRKPAFLTQAAISSRLSSFSSKQMKAVAEA